MDAKTGAGGGVVERHGLRHTSEYLAWQSMKARCMRLTHTEYPRYGGRGIRVCQEWQNSFLTFLQDVGTRPSDNLSLDRIDPDGDYKPGNVRWVDLYTQNRNFSDSRSALGLRGVRTQRKRYFAYIHVNRAQIPLGGFDNFLDACCARKSAENNLWRTA